MSQEEFDNKLLNLHEQFFHIMSDDVDEKGILIEEKILVDFLSENPNMLSVKSLIWFVDVFVGKCLKDKKDV